MDIATLTSRDICERLFDKIGSFVSVAFDHAPDDFKVLYRNAAQGFPGGFRRIEMVPKKLITKRIEKDCAIDPDVALLIMRNWFRARTALHDTAVGLLQTLGYEIFEPDFDHDAITHKSLLPQHIQSEANAHFFFPGDDVATYDKLELTVMVAMLGWFPEPPENT